MVLDKAVASAREVATGVLRSEAARVDAERAWPARGIRALQEAGLGGLVVPVDAGGLGLGLEGLARVCEVLGQECASTALCFGMHCVGSAVIAAKATPAHRERYLDPIARGRHLTTLALSEPGTGSHFYLPETAYTRTPEGGFVLDGTKSFVTNGGFADSYVVSTAPSDPNAAPGQFSCFVVPKDGRGMAWEGDWNGWGMRGNSSRVLQLRGVPLDADALLGTEGDEIWFVFNVVAPYFLVAMASTYVGIARAALELAREHLTTRTYAHTGRTLAEAQVVQHRLGTLWGQVARMRSLVHDAARMGDAGDPEALLALCSAKAEVGDVERIVSEVMTLLGGRGYAGDARIHRLFRDARAAHVMAPTTDVLRMWAGRAFLGLPVLGEA